MLLLLSVCGFCCSNSDGSSKVLVLKLLEMEAIIVLVVGRVVDGCIRNCVDGAGVDMEGSSNSACCPMLRLHTKKFFVVALSLQGCYFVLCSWC